MKLNPAALASVAGNLSQSVYMHIVHTKLVCINQKQKKMCESLWDVSMNQPSVFRFFGNRIWKPAHRYIILGVLCHFAFAICTAVLLHMGDVQYSRVCVCFLWRNVLVKDLNETSTPDAAPPGSCVDFNPVPSRLSNESKKKKVSKRTSWT